MLKMIAIGNLTGDPVLKTNEETGKPYAIMRIASDRRYKSPDGEKLTDFISIKVRGVLAERCAEFARKGCKIAASGDFETITFAEEPERQPRLPAQSDRGGIPLAPERTGRCCGASWRQRNKRNGHPATGWPFARRKEFQT